SRISDLDKMLDKGKRNYDIINERMSLLKDLHAINKRHSLDMAQKAKIRWAIEGDENSKYFHGIIKKKRSQLAIRGVLVDGEWIVDPPKVKDEFLNHFSDRFSMPSGPSINVDSIIKFPPGSNSSFITLIPKKQDAKPRLVDIISDVQSAFVSKRQILDGPFILNELLSWCKYHKTEAMIFKADFEKAFDSVRWDYLDVADKLNDPTIIQSFRRPPRGGLEEEQYGNLLDIVQSVILSDSKDRWVWSLDSTGEFSVKSARLYIDDYLLPSVGAPTRWVKEVPIKINILAWKVSLDKLPTRLNLSLRGIEISSISCPICCTAGESCSHLLFSCIMARLLISKVARWWELDIPNLLSYEDWLSWFNSLRLPKGVKDILEGIFYVMWWVIWNFRNQSLFGSSQPRKDLLFDEILLLSFTGFLIDVKVTLIGSLG
ncbi:RNA-directed DNA polymerase, eukaryota, partial [Tanacetum coccineum]